MRIAAVVPSAGSGKRLGKRLDKPFIKIGSLSIISYVLKALQASPLISEIIIAARAKDIPRIKRLIKKGRITKIRAVVKGGRTRSASVFNGLSRLSPDIDFVLIHDAARPFITQNLIRKTSSAAKRYGASVACVSVKPTIKEADNKKLLVKKTLKRSLLWEAQTPQVFRKDLLLGAYRNAGKRAGVFTDDASLVESSGEKVKIVKSSYSNIKITTPEDLVIAEAILRSCKL